MAKKPPKPDKPKKPKKVKAKDIQVTCEPLSGKALSANII